MASEITRFNEAMAKAVESLQKDMTEVKTSFARMEQILTHYSKNNELILEVIKEAEANREAQERRHFEQIKLVSDEGKKATKRAFDAIESIKTEQVKIKDRLRYFAGIAAAILFLVTFFKDPIIKAFTREQEPAEYRSIKHDGK